MLRAFLLVVARRAAPWDSEAVERHPRRDAARLIGRPQTLPGRGRFAFRVSRLRATWRFSICIGDGGMIGETYSAVYFGGNSAAIRLIFSAEY